MEAPGLERREVLVAQSCPTLCDPMDCSPSDSSVCGISKAKILEGIANRSPGDLPDPGIKPGSPVLQADSLPSEPPGKPGLEMLALLLMRVGRTAVEKAVMTEDQWGWMLE